MLSEKSNAYSQSSHRTKHKHAQSAFTGQHNQAPLDSESMGTIRTARGGIEDTPARSLKAEINSKFDKGQHPSNPGSFENGAFISGAKEPNRAIFSEVKRDNP
jgi:hypothetical protein